jgi:hypothetical protein
MTPKYLMELADVVDPDRLWALSPLDQMALPLEKRRQLDAGVALRRHAVYVRRIRGLLGTGKSLLLTPLSLNGIDIRTAPMPESIRKRLDGEQAA